MGEKIREELGKCKTKAQLSQTEHKSNLLPTKILFAREEAVNAELERLVQQGVLKKVDSNWVAPIVIERISQDLC